MTVKSSQTWTGNFVTLDATGALAAASVGPVGVLYVAGVATADVVTISGANPYKFSVPLPVLTAGQSVDLYVTATVSSIATAAFVAQDIADTKLVSDLQDIAAGALMGLADDAITAAKYDESTAYPLKSADTGSTQVVRTGADGDTAETLSDQIDGVEPADVWAYSTRTLTQAATTVAAAVAGGALTIRRGDSLSAAITGMGSLSGSSNLWFTVKRRYSDADASSYVMIDATTGLLYVNGTTASAAANGKITIDNSASGNITVTMEEVETATLPPRDDLIWDVQLLTTSGSVTTLTEGTCVVVGDVTRKVS